MKFYSLDVNENLAMAIDIEASLESYYEAIGCSCVEIAVRCIDGREFDIVCDEEGMLKEGALVSAVDGAGRPMLVGNLLFCHRTPDGELSGVTRDDVLFLEERIAEASSPGREGRWLVMTRCEYPQY